MIPSNKKQDLYNTGDFIAYIVPDKDYIQTGLVKGILVISGDLIYQLYDGTKVAEETVVYQLVPNLKR